MPVADGFFVDWDGNARNTLDPGGGYLCETDPVARYVAITTKGGTLMHEGTFYKNTHRHSKGGHQSIVRPRITPLGPAGRGILRLQRSGEENRTCFPRPFLSMRRPVASCAQTT